MTLISIIIECHIRERMCVSIGISNIESFIFVCVSTLINQVNLVVTEVKTNIIQFGSQINRKSELNRNALVIQSRENNISYFINCFTNYTCIIRNQCNTIRNTCTNNIISNCSILWCVISSNITFVTVISESNTSERVCFV